MRNQTFSKAKGFKVTPLKKKKFASPHLQNGPGLTDTKRPQLIMTPVFEISGIDTFIEMESR